MADPDKREYWQRHQTQWQQSGQSQKAYCAEHDLKVANFQYWRRRLKADQATGPKLIPLTRAHGTEPSVRIKAGSLHIEIPVSALETSLPVVLRCLSGDPQ